VGEDSIGEGGGRTFAYRKTESQKKKEWLAVTRGGQEYSENWRLYRGDLEGFSNIMTSIKRAVFQSKKTKGQLIHEGLNREKDELEGR